MGKREVIFNNNGYYHIYNRGVNRERIFFEERNYLFLLEKVQKYLVEFPVSIIAYCFMPNHYHFLLRQDSEIPISQFIQAVFNSYSKAVNRSISRSGTLFESKFKSVSVDEPDYLIHLVRYIHRNPVDCLKPLVQKLEDWPYSNYHEWIGKRNGSLVDMDFIRDHFKSGQKYAEFVQDYESQKDQLRKLKKYLFDD